MSVYFWSFGALKGFLSTGGEGPLSAAGAPPAGQGSTSASLASSATSSSTTSAISAGSPS